MRSIAGNVASTGEREDEHAVCECCAVEPSAEVFCGRRKPSSRFSCVRWVEPHGQVAASLFDDRTPRVLIDVENVSHGQAERHCRWSLQAISPIAERSDRQLLWVCTTGFDRDENVIVRHTWEASPAW